MNKYTFSLSTTECEKADITMSFEPEGMTHMEVTEFYLRFLRACGFYVNFNMTDPDVNELADDYNPVS